VSTTSRRPDPLVALVRAVQQIPEDARQAAWPAEAQWPSPNSLALSTCRRWCRPAEVAEPSLQET
jgi:hypothetical protein